MAGVQDQLEIKFRLTDGTDIGPKTFPSATSVATLKESVLAQWPKEKENGPRTVKDVKLISAGKILENNKTLGECQSPLCDIPGGLTTMHVVVQPPPLEKGKMEGKPFCLENFQTMLATVRSMDTLDDVCIALTLEKFNSVVIHLDCWPLLVRSSKAPD